MVAQGVSPGFVDPGASGTSPGDVLCVRKVFFLFFINRLLGGFHTRFFDVDHPVSAVVRCSGVTVVSAMTQLPCFTWLRW